MPAQQGPFSPLWTVDRRKATLCQAAGTAGYSRGFGEKAHRLCRLSSSHGGVRLFGETGTRRCHLIPCARAGKPTRLRASTLGAGFDPEDIKAVIAGERPLPEMPEEPTVPPRRVNLIIDIQKRMAQGKGPAYERWAKVYNLKQMAAALQYLQEHHLTDYAALTARTEAAVDHFHKLSDELRTTEEALSKTSELMAATVDYAKTRPVFDGYKAARYSKKYLAQHEVELATYRAAKDTMNTILNGAKLPKIEALKKSRRELAGQKKELYAEYRDAQRQMREAVAIKANIDHLLGITDERENKAQER